MTCVVNAEETAYTWYPAVHKNDLGKDRFMYCDGELTMTDTKTHTLWKNQKIKRSKNSCGTNKGLSYISPAAGCRLYRTDKYLVTYPTSIVTSEEYSPPIQFNNFMSVTLACQPGIPSSSSPSSSSSNLAATESSVNVPSYVMLKSLAPLAQPVIPYYPLQKRPMS